ncbi:MAG: sigma-54-dependent Fis family transcriptional regulator [Acidobacteria bacterium]|nr:MAG: sigma-54-dependent Fis family transcriptional regulator [Acidobacteriota bacterium]
MANVLIVDDEERIRGILALLLRDHRHRVAEAASGEEALALAASFHPDLVLLDLNMPGLDGLETLRRLQASRPEADVIIMTAYGTIRSAVEAMRSGAFDYLTKPFDNDELLLLVDRALNLRRLSAEVESLRDELEARYGFTEIIGISPQMQEVFRTMAKVARVDATVLVTGESGTGKELVARAIHRKSKRSLRPFVAVNCSAIPHTLVEAEFFGHERGAFTDAHESRAGTFEQADGGTLFLDEVGDLALDAQAKLLRALQERKIVRVGGRAPREVDVRVIAATNKDLEQEVGAGRFREDLYWRLNVVQVRLPALRQRVQDLPLLIEHFLDRINRELGLKVRGLEDEAQRLLLAYPWPGNVRELENTLCRAMILCEGDLLAAVDLPGRLRDEPGEGAAPPASDLDHMALAEAVSEATERLEKRMIRSRLAAHKGNRTATAESLGISRKTLFNKMRHYGLTAADGGLEAG